MKRFLVAVDLQKDFINGALGTPEAERMIPAAVEKIKSFEGTIFATLDTHDEGYLETSEGKKLPVPHCIEGTPGHDLDEHVKCALEEKGYTLVYKNTFGAVKLPGLLWEAAAGEEFSVEFIGLCTDICVVSNVLLVKAHFPEAPLSVFANCCAGVTPEKHAAALSTMKSCQIDVVE